MRIVVVGVTGATGSRIAAEAVRREHVVTGVARTSRRVEGLPPHVEVLSVDATDTAVLTELFTHHDAVVATTRPDAGDESSVSNTTASLLEAAASADRPIVVVGGAGPLLVPLPDEHLVVDDTRYVGAGWRDIAMSSVVQLEVCRDHRARWRYLSPPAMLAPGVRTGSYRTGTARLLTGADGDSRISMEDLAVAVVDALESPSAQRHFTVAN